MASGRVASAVQIINAQLAVAPQAAHAVPAEELPLWKTITTSVDDGGLSAVLKATRVHDQVVELIVSTDGPSDSNPQGGVGCELLEDLLALSSEQREYEDLKLLLDTNLPTKGRPAFLARFR